MSFGATHCQNTTGWHLATGVVERVLTNDCHELLLTFLVEPARFGHRSRRGMSKTIMGRVKTDPVPLGASHIPRHIIPPPPLAWSASLVSERRNETFVCCMLAPPTTSLSDSKYSKRGFPWYPQNVIFCHIRIRGGRGPSPQVSPAEPIGSALIRATTL